MSHFILNKATFLLKRFIVYSTKFTFDIIVSINICCKDFSGSYQEHETIIEAVIAVAYPIPNISNVIDKFF